jgi:hypothetical protein
MPCLWPTQSAGCHALLGVRSAITSLFLGTLAEKAETQKNEDSLAAMGLGGLGRLWHLQINRQTS